MSPQNHIWLTDMRSCLPKPHLSNMRRKGAWKYVSYESENGPKGIGF